MKKFFVFFLLVIFFLGISSLFLFFYFFKDLPKIAELETLSFQPRESTKIFDRTGEHLLYEIYNGEKRTIVPWEKIPDSLKQATIAIEDKDFYQHPALSWKSILRAIWVNFYHRRIVQGASTITQQLARNAFLVPERSLKRKIREAILAFLLEKKYSKDKILYFYLNQVFYGNNCYGVGAAAKVYFGKPVENLSLAESALLAALPWAPSYLSPYGSHLDKLLERKNIVLKKMFEQGYITQEEFEKAKNEKIEFKPRKEKIFAPHFVMYVKDKLFSEFGQDFLERGGLKIYTTLDWRTQQLAEETIKWGVERNRELANAYNAGMVVQQAKTGEILAMVGSYDYFAKPFPEGCQSGQTCLFDPKVNVTTFGQGRQPGSAFKPFAYLQAFIKGYSPETVVFDLKTNFETDSSEEKKYEPENFDHRFRGPVSFRNALAQSINVPSVKVLYLAGLKETLSLAKKLGISTLTSPERYGLTLVLGGGEVRLIDMVEAYSVFACQGKKHNQKVILKIVDSQGKVIKESKDEVEEVIDPEKVKILNNVLSDNQARAPLYGGLNNQIQLPDREIAAKTGTTNDSRDAWIFAYTPSYVVGIWVGNNNNAPMLKKGSSILLAVPLWRHFADVFFLDKPKEEFEKPEIKEIAKPMLNGKYIAFYKEEGKLKPQVHNILYYVNKEDPLGEMPEKPEEDPQFENWEKPVLEWLKESGFDLNFFNQPIKYSTKIKPLLDFKENEEKLEIIQPSNGDFIERSFLLRIKINQPIKKIAIYFNEEKLKEINNLLPQEKKIILRAKKIDLQNKLTLKVYPEEGEEFEKNLILFQKIPEER